MANSGIAGQFRIHGIVCGDAVAILQWQLTPLLDTREQLSSIFPGMTASAEAASVTTSQIATTVPPADMRVAVRRSARCGKDELVGNPPGALRRAATARWRVMADTLRLARETPHSYA